MNRIFSLLISHLFVLVVGIYALPIITAPSAPDQSDITEAANQAIYQGVFQRDLKGSDFLHWGEGDIFVGKRQISLKGSIAPGPDYKLYLAPQLIETKTQFEEFKSKMVQVGDIKTFDNFIVSVPDSIDPSDYSAVVIWCESFGAFITSARYQ